MEVKTSKAGLKRYPRELKRLAVEKRRNENWTWPETVEWIEEEHGIKIPHTSCYKWEWWYQEYQAGRAATKVDETPNKKKHWRPEEDDILRMCTDEGLTAYQIAEFMEDTPELNFRRYTVRSIEGRRMKLNIKVYLPTNRSQNEDTIKELKEAFSKKKITLVEYINTYLIPVQCDICNYEWNSSKYSIIGQDSGCPRCSGTHVGGKPTGPQPALVYLLIFSEWGKCKIGYAEIKNSLSPEEAIHRTSKSRKYPYPYTIGAYDLSTKTEAGELEEELKAQTAKSRSFVEVQEFNGYTEFRNIEVVKQILPQFKTVLDIALKI